MTCDASAACPITNVKWSDYESLLKISDIEYGPIGTFVVL